MKKFLLFILTVSLMPSLSIWAQDGPSVQSDPYTAVWGTRVPSQGGKVHTDTAVWGTRRPPVSRDLLKTTPGDQTPIDVIVQFTTAPTTRHHSKVINLGGSLKQEFGFIKGSAYRMPASAVAELAKDPEVVYISPDRPLRGLVDYAVAATNAGMVQSMMGLDGSGVGVAVIDSGVTSSADLTNKKKSSVVYSQDFVSGSGLGADAYGHGTHVTGILTGNGSKSTGSQYTRTFRGFAPGASVINLRVLDQNGNGTDSAVIAAISQAIQLHWQYNIRVINLSLGRPVFESYTVDPLCQAVEAAWKAGIVVVVAAGNMGRDNTFGENGYGTIQAPGNDPYVITVGAMKTMGTPGRTDDQMASYSSKGPTAIDHIVKPDIVAPGNREISVLSSTGLLAQTFPQNAVANSAYMSPAPSGNSSDYFTLSGTSMATPAVSGTVALMLQQNWKLTPDTVKARLMKSAGKSFPMSTTAVDPVTGASYTTYYDIFTVGTGYLDSYAAVTNSDSLPSGANAMSPTAVVDPLTGKIKIVTGQSSVWVTGLDDDFSLVWGTSVVWGSSVLAAMDDGSGDFSLVWGTSTVWNSSTNSAFSLIWGSSVVWGTSAPAAETSTISIYGEP